VLTCILVSRPKLPQSSTYDTAVSKVVKGVVGSTFSPTSTAYVYGNDGACNICGPSGYCFVFELVFEALISMYVELAFQFSGTALQDAWKESVPLLLTQVLEVFGTSNPGTYTAIMEFTENRTTDTNVTSDYAGFGTLQLLYSAILACAQSGGEGTAECSGTALYKPTCLCVS
jgi:hypothetical protein